MSHGPSAALITLSLLVLAPLAPAQAAASPCLLEISTEPGVRTLALHDFDRDGALDVVVLTATRAVIHRGHGDATFDPPLTVATGTDLRDVIVDDFDENGVADLALADRTPNGVKVLLGRADGPFDPPVVYAVGNAPVSIAHGDFDEDGIEDLAVLDEVDGRARLMRGLGAGGAGDGTFQLYTFVLLTRAGSAEPHLQIVDVDGDGMLDLTANVSNLGAFHQIAIAYATGSSGVGSGFFAATTYFDTAVAPSDFRIVDVDLDGRNDIVLSYTGLKYVEFHSGLGNRMFGSFHLEVVDVFPGRLAVADLEGDGLLEVLFSSTDRTGILPVHQGGTWPERIGTERARVSLGPGPLLVASLNSDPVVDVLTCATGASTFVVQTGECQPEQNTLDLRPEGLWGSQGRALITGPNGREGVSAVSDGNGGAYLTWRDHRDLAEGEIHMTRIGPDGFAIAPWPAQGRTIRPPAGGSPDAGPIPDGNGGVYVVVGEGVGTARRLVVEHLTAEGEFADAWPVGGFALTTPDFAPQFIVSDGLGGLIAVGRYSAAAGGQEIRARRWTASATVAPGWPGEGVLVVGWGTGTSLTMTSAVPDGSGGVYVSWDTYIPPCSGHGCGFGSWYDNFAYVVGGVVVWGAGSGPDAVGSPWLVTDDRGGAFGSYTQGGAQAFLGVWTPAGARWASPSPFDLWNLYGGTGDGDNGAVFVGWLSDQGYYIDRFNRTGGRPPGSWAVGGNFLFSAEGFVGMKGDLLGGALVLSRTTEIGLSHSLMARYVSNLGTPAPGWSSAGHVLRTSSSIPDRMPLLLDGRGGMLLFWDDPNGGAPAIFGQRLGSDIPVPILLSLVDVEADHGFVRLRWILGVDAEGAPVVERRPAGEDGWTVIGAASPEADGRFYAFEDRTVVPGERLEYRLAVHREGGLLYSDVVSVEVASFRPALALSPRRQPARRGDVLRFTLADRVPAMLDAFDVRGRRVWTESIAGLEPGPHERALPPSLRAGGIYWLRLTQGTESVRTRIVLLD